MEGDRGYDDKNLIVKLLDKQKIKSVIDICNKWIDPTKHDYFCRRKMSFITQGDRVLGVP